MSPNASHTVRPGLSSAASLITSLLISFDQEVLNQHLNLVTPEYPFFESPCAIAVQGLTPNAPYKLRHNRRVRAPCFSSSHSPGPRSLSPVLSTNRCTGAVSPPASELGRRGCGTSTVAA